MGLHVIVGAGPVGSGTALRLAEAGHRVRVITRSGGGPRHESIELVAADAADAAVLRRLARGADALYNCANPSYHRWPRDWPPLAAALLATAEHTGAGLVTMGNLYGYGVVDRPLTEDLPLAAASVKGKVRARMWTEALASHQAGRARVTEARASDYFGPTVATNTMIGSMFVPRLLAGRAAYVLGQPDVPHSWSYLPDVTRALALLGTADRAWGRPWHVPVAPPESLRALARRVAAFADPGGVRPEPVVRRIPEPLVRAIGLVVPLVREFAEVRYQHDRPFVMDSTAFTTVFGVEATAMDEAVRATVDWWRSRHGAAPRGRTG